MGLLEFINRANDQAVRQYDKLEREVTRSSKKYERYDNRRLADAHRNATGIERAACAMEIKRRRSELDE